MKKLMILMASMLLFQFQLSASELKTDEAKALAEELKLTINSTISKIVELEKTNHKTSEGLKLSFSDQSSTKASLGLVMDAKSKVLAVTPNSIADSLGVVSGDVIQAVKSNDINFDLTKSFSAIDVSKDVSVTVLRNGEEVMLSTSLVHENYNWTLFVESEKNNEPTDLKAGAEQCGQVSVFLTPPYTKHVYPAFIRKIDGRSIIKSKKTLMLKPGKHEILLQELIPLRHLSYRTSALNRTKTIEIYVEANKSYALGAQFQPIKRHRRFNEEYWEPVVWKTSDVKCQL